MIYSIQFRSSCFFFFFFSKWRAQTWLHRKTFLLFISWRQYGAECFWFFLHICPGKKQKKQTSFGLCLVFLQPRLNCVAVKLPLCIRETFLGVIQHGSWCTSDAFALAPLWMHALLVQDHLLPTFICRAILKLTWFVWHWFQLHGPFGSCWWRDSQNSITRLINQRVHLWAASIIESVG